MSKEEIVAVELNPVGCASSVDDHPRRKPDIA